MHLKVHINAKQEKSHMASTLTKFERFDLRSSGAGFTDWIKAFRGIGDRALVAALRAFDSEPTASGGNAHRSIHERVDRIGLPAQSRVFVTIHDFLSDPEACFSKIPDGDYYFASIKPGVHLAHVEDTQTIIDFVANYSERSEDGELGRELFISHNGEPVMSGHIIVEEGRGMEPHTLHGEFTIGNFNDFHRGFHTPEISLDRSFLGNVWAFRDALDPENQDWRDESKFKCNGGVEFTRTQMATEIHNAIQYIPHDGDLYLPGYYEILFERTGETAVRPVFIEAVVDGL